MKYCFYETVDISDIQRDWLNKYYINYVDKESIELYELLVNQSFQVNILFDSNIIFQKINVDSNKLMTLFEQLSVCELIKIYKDSERFVFELLLVRVGSSFFDSNFVKEESPYKYSTLKSITFKNIKKSYSFESIEVLLKNININLKDEDYMRLDKFNSVYKMKTLSLCKLIKKSYNTASMKLDFDKMSYYARSINRKKSKFSLEPGILEFINIQTKGLYANKDIDAFLQLIEKYDNLENFHIKSIITYVYSTQDNVYFNFIDKLALSLLKSNFNDYEQCLKYLNSNSKAKISFNNKISKKVKNITLDNLSRGKDNNDKNGILIKDLIGK